ncbi:hypothetical protein TsFJ059_009871 [Trichoderma semiorbis]|uniref:Endonuclease/exonuclease/phosphatase domain-containing protein n=1 Tax=Trichoderma semiorbis TaxID=1491008 RepID=A0A9P8KS03_9HYPO|nr:hypothetical protein TsFJ059_009871 [Trichoderma semiorbis]
MAVKSFVALAAVLGSAAAISIAEINGDRYISPFKDKTVTDIKGLVTATNSNGIFLRSTEPDENPATSEGLFVFNSAAAKTVKVGDIITLDGLVVEYRSNANYIYLTEINKPTNIKVVSSGNEVKPLVIGVDTSFPPTKDFSSLDQGGIFGVPNAVANISSINPQLQPDLYGLDFWESLLGEYVTIKDAYQISRPNNFGDVYIRGNWPVTGLNAHGGLTMLEGDANPEVITIGTPLDGSKNPFDTRMGDYLGDITGVVYNDFGSYRLLPLTHLSPLKNATTDFPAVSFNSTGDCLGITVGDYNTENLMPDSPHLPLVVDHIVNKLRTPDLIFLQEVQDNSGNKNDGIVDANVTLTTLASKIEEASGIVYDFAEISPINNKDGGEPGGNIRQAYFYRSDVLQLYKPNLGGSLDVNEVLDGPELKYNPGRIDPLNTAWDSSRKPLAAAWKTVKGTKKIFFTINVHLVSKGGSTSLSGDLRPPVNQGVEKRTVQTSIVAEFVAEILSQDPAANILVAGDFNEYSQVDPLTTFSSISGLTDLDEVVGIDPVERYTYLFDMNTEELDHMYVSEGLHRDAKYEHLHLNTWQNNDGQVSDHDPSVARFNLCGCSSKKTKKSN